MTITSENYRVSQAGDGSNKAFTVTWRILDQTHIDVYVRDTNGVGTLQVLDTDYTVSGVKDPNATVTFVTAPGATDTVIIIPDVPTTQLTDYKEFDKFPAESHESALDKLTNMFKMFRERLDRAMTIGPTEEASVLADLKTALTTLSGVLIGASTSDPTLRLDGSALQAGDLYVNTVSDEIRIWTGSAWIAGIAGSEPVSVAQVANRAALATLSTANTGFLKEAGREGAFVWDGSDLSTAVTNDPGEGIYVPPSTDVTGASGAWVRVGWTQAQMNWFGVSTGNTAAANDTALADFMTWFNSAGKQAATCAPGTYAISVPIPDITGTDKTITVAPHSVRLQMDAAVTNGQFFGVGDGTAASAARIQIKGFDLQIQNVAGTVTGYAYEVDGANDVFITDSRCLLLAGLARFGNTNRVSRVEMIHIRGTYGDNNNHSVIAGRIFSNLKLDDMRLNGSNTKGSQVTAAVIDMNVTALCDTLLMDQVEIWSTDSTTYWLECIINAAGEELVNVWITNCIGDKCGDAGAALLLQASGSADGRLRNWFITNFRADTGGDVPGGKTVWIRQNSSSGSLIRNIVFNNLSSTYRDISDPAIKLDASGTDEIGAIVFNSPIFKESISAGLLNAVVEIGVSDVTFNSPVLTFEENTAATHTQYFFKTTADVDNVIISDALVKTEHLTGLTGVIQHFSYATVPTRMVINSNMEYVPAFTIASSALSRLAEVMTADTGGGAANLDTINGGKTGDMLTLFPQNSSDTVTVRDKSVSTTGNIELDTAATTFAMDNALDTITLVKRSDALGWTEVSRSSNGT